MKKKIAKTPHSSTPPVLLSKGLDWNDYLHPQSFLHDPSRDGYINRLIYSMYVFFDDEDKLELEEFCQVHRLNVETFRLWRKADQQLAKEVENIKRYLAVRRRKQVMQFKLKESAAYKDMHTLDPEWALIDQYHARLKAAEQEVEKDFTVIMKTAKAKDVS
jgi:hypothetical protein